MYSRGNLTMGMGGVEGVYVRIHDRIVCVLREPLVVPPSHTLTRPPNPHYRVIHPPYPPYTPYPLVT